MIHVLRWLAAILLVVATAVMIGYLLAWAWEVFTDRAD